MIKLERTRDNSITETLRGVGRVAKLELLVKAQGEIIGGTLQKHDFNSSYWTKAKLTLKKESNNKCAYCETPVATVAHGDVEHFRPKSVYWWLAYCYDNYSFSCQICNQIYKKDKFPFHGTKLREPKIVLPLDAVKTKKLVDNLCPDPVDLEIGYKFSNFVSHTKTEKAGLPDPYIFDPETFFKWKFDEVLEEVEIVARNNYIGTKRAFEAVIDCLGLNREELRQQRGMLYLTLDTFRNVLESGQMPPATLTKIKKQIKRMMEPKAPYAGMVRYFVKTEWKLNLD